MTAPTRIQGLPDLIYGTAFKFDRSAELVESALTIGFRALDTASSKHAYREKLVGDGLAAAIFAGKVKREELYVSDVLVSLLYCRLLQNGRVLHVYSITCHGRMHN